MLSAGKDAVLLSQDRRRRAGLVTMHQTEEVMVLGSQSVRTSPHVGGSPDPVLNTYLLYDIHSPLDKIPERS